MNWLLPAVLLFLLASALDGHRKGLIKKSVGVVSLVLTLLVTSTATPYIAAWLQENTALYDVLRGAVQGSQVDIFETMTAIGLGEEITAYLATLLLQAVAFLITLLLVGVLVQGAAFSLGIAAKLPVLHGFNKLAGLVFGFAEGVFFVWILFFLITVLSATELGGKLLLMIADSDILSWIYRKNLLFAFLKLRG